MSATGFSPWVSTKNLTWIALILVIVGGLNWGLTGLFNFDLVAIIFGTMSGPSRLIYVLVGLSALYLVFVAKKLMKDGQ
jgi:uncharacterized membrane protein YuzA (DUF378 family)